ncbi:rhodanese-like domain-containing protein [Desulfurivibrio sp. D14AmB]|uniref:rhodanese-like domain-containing protein n=1 Tax=Desulfurivibrio sp. D14AmB TaxID=3374370 RepID=UPI00376EBB4E
MQNLKRRFAQLGVLALACLLLTACGGMGGATAANDSAARAPGPKAVEQDPALRITTTEVMELFSQVYGDKPLTKPTLDANDRFLLVDTRPLGRFQEGTVPGSIHIPVPRFQEEIPKLPKDRTIIFYCGGLT